MTGSDAFMPSASALAFPPSECDRIPVHNPSLIQPHGALLVVRPDDLVVLQASANADRWPGRQAATLLGPPARAALGEETTQRLRAAISHERLDGGPRFAVTLPAASGRPALDVTLHASDGLFVLEVEAAGRTDASPGEGSTFYFTLRGSEIRV